MVVRSIQRLIPKNMASTPRQGKRKPSGDRSISPPPLRRKLESSTTPSAVSSFFTPASQKLPTKMTWQERAPNEGMPNTLLVGTYKPSSSLKDSSNSERRSKIAAFDFDSTLIGTKSGKKFSSDPQDWKWWHATVPKTLRELHVDGYQIVVISNQAGISFKADSRAPKAQHTRLQTFKSKVSEVLESLNIPISIYAATSKDVYRKPCTGMWQEMSRDYDIHRPGDINLEKSLFVGDAAGRHAGPERAKDFSCSDRNFAENVGIKFYTPEEFFLKEAPRPFTRAFVPADHVTEMAQAAYCKKNAKEIVLLCGSPGAGKSTFYWKQLEPLGYSRVNQDLLKTRDRCIKSAGELLEQGKSVAVDNTNADRDTRAKWIALATKHSVPIRCVLFTAGTQLCEHNAVVRALNHAMNPENREILPRMAFTSFVSRFQRPDLSEGFQDIIEATFKFSGTEAEKAIWLQHWT